MSKFTNISRNIYIQTKLYIVEEEEEDDDEEESSQIRTEEANFEFIDFVKKLDIYYFVLN